MRARLSHEAPSDLRILFRTPGIKEWLTSIATPSQLVDTVERIGGTFAQKLEWLEYAGVGLAPNDARRKSPLTEATEALLNRFDRYRTIVAIEDEIAKFTAKEASSRANTKDEAKDLIAAEYAELAPVAVDPSIVWETFCAFYAPGPVFVSRAP